MAAPAFIAGDWGTTYLRLHLCDGNGMPLESCSGAGASQVKGDFAAVLAAATVPWRTAHGSLPAVLCGMVGSSIGWVNVPYLSCPCSPARIAGASARIEGGSVVIAPGLSCRNANGAPDVLRGEETQMLGALQLQPALGTGRRLLCLPGTHTKWALLEEGIVREFVTAATGELFALISLHSVLVRAEPSAQSEMSPSFDQAVKQVAAHPDANILQLLFECRSRQMTGEFSSQNALDYLSGLLIATEVTAGLRAYAPQAPHERAVTLIGTPELTRRYAAILATHGVSVGTMDGANASLAGLKFIYSELFKETPVRAS
jgi:2-dehydro-3-deoxygalactonokinase